MCVTQHMNDMNVNLQGANRLANEIFNKQQRPTAETATKQYDVLHVLRQCRQPMDAN